jgi:hypothetical protein
MSSQLEGRVERFAAAFFHKRLFLAGGDNFMRDLLDPVLESHRFRKAGSVKNFFVPQLLRIILLVLSVSNCFGRAWQSAYMRVEGPVIVVLGFLLPLLHHPILLFVLSQLACVKREVGARQSCNLRCETPIPVLYSSFKCWPLRLLNFTAPQAILA